MNKARLTTLTQKRPPACGYSRTTAVLTKDDPTHKSCCYILKSSKTHHKVMTDKQTESPGYIVTKIQDVTIESPPVDCIIRCRDDYNEMKPKHPSLCSVIRSNLCRNDERDVLSKTSIDQGGVGITKREQVVGNKVFKDLSSAVPGKVIAVA